MTVVAFFRWRSSFWFHMNQFDWETVCWMLCKCLILDILDNVLECSNSGIFEEAQRWIWLYKVKLFNYRVGVDSSDNPSSVITVLLFMKCPTVDWKLMIVTFCSARRKHNVRSSLYERHIQHIWKGVSQSMLYSLPVKSESWYSCCCLWVSHNKLMLDLNPYVSHFLWFNKWLMTVMLSTRT